MWAHPRRRRFGVSIVTADCAYRSPQHSQTQLSSTTHGTTAAGRAGNARKYGGDKVSVCPESVRECLRITDHR